MESAPILAKQRSCKTIFVSADRDTNGFEESCAKVRGIDVMPYDREKTTAMRDLFGIKPIPALIVVKNSNFGEESPIVVGNARHMIEKDPALDGLDWDAGGSVSTLGKPVVRLTLKERIFKGGKYGKWWRLGHRNINPEYPGKMYMVSAMTVLLGYPALHTDRKGTCIVSYHFRTNTQ